MSTVFPIITGAFNGFLKSHNSERSMGIATAGNSVATILTMRQVFKGISIAEFNFGTINVNSAPISKLKLNNYALLVPSFFFSTAWVWSVYGCSELLSRGIFNLVSIPRQIWDANTTSVQK